MKCGTVQTFPTTVKVQLSYPNIAVDQNGEKGNWTMLMTHSVLVRFETYDVFFYLDVWKDTATTPSSNETAWFYTNCSKSLQA